MMDSVTRLATAQREVGLAIGEPPATRGYTPSVFAILPRLLERAGAAATGSITALYTVLVEGDDMNEPVADAVRSILDGHIVLSRELAHRHHYPAIDVLQSVSRVAPRLLSPREAEAAGRLRGLLAAHKRAEDLIAIGAYVPGTDPRVDEARAKLDRIEGFLCQSVDGDYSRDEALSRLLQLTDVPPGPSSPAPELGPVPAGTAPAGGLTGAFNPLPAGAEVVPG
jgi:flagellum-specific ATP synthase